MCIHEAAPQGDGAPGQLHTVSVGTRGVAVYPGQSGEDVLIVANIIDAEFDVGHYVAREIARRILLALVRREDAVS